MARPTRRLLPQALQRKGHSSTCNVPQQLADFNEAFLQVRKVRNQHHVDSGHSSQFQHMFGAQDDPELQLECFTTVHSDVFGIDIIRTLVPLLLVPTGSTR